jgi:hypothetical protein
MYIFMGFSLRVAGSLFAANGRDSSRRIESQVKKGRGEAAEK